MKNIDQECAEKIAGKMFHRDSQLAFRPQLADFPQSWSNEFSTNLFNGIEREHRAHHNLGRLFIHILERINEILSHDTHIVGGGISSSGHVCLW